MAGNGPRANVLAANTVTTGETTIAPEQWRFLAQADVALDETTSIDELEATVLGIVVPRLADLCVVRLRGDLALELEAPVSSAHARAELLPFVRRPNAKEPDVLSSRHPAERVLATGEADWGDVDARLLEAVARDPEHLARLRTMVLVSASPPSSMTGLP